ncbi:hypothetical protein DMH01_36595 [Amycolatopsis sp. WAC 04182]|uniref:DUF3237 family protein n=1 Tax=Amycolatopsis sp. WAC 04182 TaxID=2203198 RepID=UPI000F76F11A|nr:DUF3237 family protein [Amycolatopsis sp. WAC 04182]RSN54459.1 hypothetical protein DMH01_36595 [Amycolatopsis sp. WAC 04182]
MSHPELVMELVARLEVLIAEPIDTGVTPAGRRRIVPITGGTVMSPRIDAPGRPVSHSSSTTSA